MNTEGPSLGRLHQRNELKTKLTDLHLIDISKLSPSVVTDFNSSSQFCHMRAQTSKAGSLCLSIFLLHLALVCPITSFLNHFNSIHLLIFQDGFPQKFLSNFFRCTYCEFHRIFLYLCNKYTIYINNICFSKQSYMFQCMYIGDSHYARQS